MHLLLLNSLVRMQINLNLQESVHKVVPYILHLLRLHMKLAQVMSRILPVLNMLRLNSLLSLVRNSLLLNLPIPTTLL